MGRGMLAIWKGRADPALLMDLVLSGYIKPPREARKLHLCMAPPPDSNHSTLCGCTCSQRRKANACWANQSNASGCREHQAFATSDSAATSAELQAPIRPEHCGGITPLPSTQQRLETLRASRFAGWVHVNTKRRFTAASSGISRCENTTASQAAEHPLWMLSFQGSSVDQVTCQFLEAAVLQNCACRV